MALGNVTLLKYYARICHELQELRDFCNDFKNNVEDTITTINLYVDDQPYEEFFEESIDLYKENVEYLIEELGYIQDLKIEEEAFEESFESLDEIINSIQRVVFDVEVLFTSLETFLMEGTEDALEKVQTKQMETEENILELKKVCKEVYFNYYEKIQFS